MRNPLFGREGYSKAAIRARDLFSEEFVDDVFYNMPRAVMLAICFAPQFVLPAGMFPLAKTNFQTAGIN